LYIFTPIKDALYVKIRPHYNFVLRPVGSTRLKVHKVLQIKNKKISL